MKYIWFLTAALCACGAVAEAGTASGDLLDEDFEGLTLLPNVEETRGGDFPLGTPGLYTKTPPTDWVVDSTAVPNYDADEDPDNNAGVEEWEGWSFVLKDFFTNEGQGREGFTRGSNIVAVADPDEYDDVMSGIGPSGTPYYETHMSTPFIDLTGIAAGTTLYISFDSSFRGEDPSDEGDDNQTAVVTASYGFGFSGSEELLHWASDPADPDYRPGVHEETIAEGNPAIDEEVMLSFVVPTLDLGLENVSLTFSMLTARNDWWWAIDNVKVGTSAIPEPTSFGLIGLGLAGLLALAYRRSA